MGRTEKEAAGELWTMIVLQQANKIDEAFTFTEIEALEKLYQFLEARGETNYKLSFLDFQENNYGTKLSDGTILYYTNVRRGLLRDEFELYGREFVAKRRGQYFIVKDSQADEIAKINLSGKVHLFYSDIPEEQITKIETISITSN